MLTVSSIVTYRDPDEINTKSDWKERKVRLPQGIRGRFLSSSNSVLFFNREVISACDKVSLRSIGNVNQDWNTE